MVTVVPDEWDENVHARSWRQRSLLASNVVEAGLPVVDKTAPITHLLSVQHALLVRPEGMGKKLLADMLEDLFVHGTTNFEGMAIQKQWPETKTYPVVRFAWIMGYNDNDPRDLYASLYMLFQEVGLPLSEELMNDTDSAFIQAKLAEVLREQPIVFLFEDWDSLLNRNLAQPEAFAAAQRQVRVLLHWLYTSPGIHFSLVTGEHRYPELELFQDTPCVDLSFAPELAALLGFTQNELEQYYRPWIKQAAQLHQLTCEQFLALFWQHYGGYCFDPEGKVKVYCPDVVNQFFQQLIAQPNKPPKFGSFGWSLYIKPVLEQAPPAISLFADLARANVRWRPPQPSVGSAAPNIELIPFLADEGWLTLSSVQLEPDSAAGSEYRYVVPNARAYRFLVHTLFQSMAQHFGLSPADDDNLTLLGGIDCPNWNMRVSILNFMLERIPRNVLRTVKIEELQQYLSWVQFLTDCDSKRALPLGRGDFTLNGKPFLLALEPPLLGADPVECLEAAKEHLIARYRSLEPELRPLKPPRWGLALLLSPMKLHIIHWSVIDLEYELVLSMGYLPLPEEPTKRQKRQK